ncbi:MAG TPA: hypothetical protein VMW17_21365, partial [Candidatus Binatia bacterium]|nr:hypothetical protein [Candidatus Binatia bacterium]
MAARYALRILSGYSVFVFFCFAGSWVRPAAATNVSGSCPAGGFTAAGSPWDFTGAVTIAAATTCTVQAGATLNGNGHGLTVNGTLNAQGTSTGSRDVVFNNIQVSFGTTGAGLLKYCTVNQNPSG